MMTAPRLSLATTPDAGRLLRLALRLVAAAGALGAVGLAAGTLRSTTAGLADRESLTALGVAVVLVQATAVAVFAELRWLGLRRAR
jgi:hypothetical protein